METDPVDYLRSTDSRERAAIHPKLAAWTEAYSRLKTARALVRAAGPKASWQMRDDRDALQRLAEKALALLTAEDASRRSAPGIRPD
jgi:hypothetical protein